MHFGFLWQGIVIFVLPMLINILYVVLPHQGGSAEENRKYPVTEGIEQVTRILYLIALCVLKSEKTILYTSPFLYVSIAFLALYYICWIRYFAGKRKLYLLSKAFCGVPQPLSVFPVLYFLTAALWLHNFIAFGIMIVFGIAHNIVSYRNRYSE